MRIHKNPAHVHTRHVSFWSCVANVRQMGSGRGFDEKQSFIRPAVRNEKPCQILSENRNKTTKKPTFLVGSFVSSLAVPTDFEAVERNWLSVHLRAFQGKQRYQCISNLQLGSIEASGKLGNIWQSPTWHLRRESINCSI
jgi:hypothetical protein